MVFRKNGKWLQLKGWRPLWEGGVPGYYIGFQTLTLELQPVITRV